MVAPLRRVCYVLITVNVVLVVVTLIVAVIRFIQPRAQPSSCLPGLRRTAARGGASTLAPPSTAETDVMKLTWETIQQAVEERNNNYQEAEYFRTKMPQDLKPLAHVVLEPSQIFTRDKNLLWDVDANHTQSRLQGFQYDQRGYLRVPENGYYFVYVDLHYVHKHGIGFDRDRLKDYIFRNEKRFVDNPELCEKLKKKLLFNEQTPCTVVPRQIPLPASYQGTVVYLKRDDMLSVASGLPENLHNEAEESYFGVYLV